VAFGGIPTTDCLKSVIRNISGETRYFSFLPPHGRLMGPDEEIAVTGSVMTAIQEFHGGDGERHFDALDRALLRGELTLIGTNNPILFDPIEDESYMLVVTGGTVAVAEPCWFSSAAFALLTELSEDMETEDGAILDWRA
jgi:hypothetical protein